MTWHSVALDDSFEQNIGSLPKLVQDEMALVLRGLEVDPYFVPDSNYSTEQDVDKFFVCEHKRGWDGWVLGWFFEYWPNTAASVQNVVAFLHDRAHEATSNELFYEIKACDPDPSEKQ